MIITVLKRHYRYTLCVVCIDGNASKPRISKMHNVQETQRTVSKQTGD